MIIIQRIVSYVLDCFDKNEIYIYLTNLLQSTSTLDEGKSWILTQTDFDDPCIRTILFNDRRIVFYGESIKGLKGKNTASSEERPTVVCEYTDLSFLYSPIQPYTASNGKVLVNVLRAVELLTQKFLEFMMIKYPNFQFGKVELTTFEGKQYYAFEYKVTPLKWKSWF